MKATDDPLDVFYLFFGLLRDAIKEVSPETWRNLLKQTSTSQQETKENN
tara:strand:- start:1184 stop:1330 length:147 start_codon:yes stop_codon:yes gene_type:complete